MLSMRLALAAMLLLAAFAISLRGQGSSRAASLALVGGTIYTDPASDPIRDGLVLIQSGRIAAVGARRSIQIPDVVRTIDCVGLTVAAGFWNSHVHFLQRKWADAATMPAPELTRQLQVMLTQYGFTSVFDTWSAWENTRQIRARIESGEVAGPRIRSTGEAMFGPGTAVTPAQWGSLGFMPLDRFQMTPVGTPEEATTATTALLGHAVDGLKFYAATPGVGSRVVPEGAMAVAVKQAHMLGKPVFAHPSTVTGLLASVRAGVDVLTHTTPQTGPWDAATIAAMKQANVAITPTLKLWSYEMRNERTSLADRFEDTAIGQIRAWNAAGGVILFGTDVGYMSDYETATEYALMVRAGMSARQILASLTTVPAERFGVSKDLGRVAPGLLGDLVVLRGDPSASSRPFADIVYTIRDGQVIYTAER